MRLWFVLLFMFNSGSVSAEHFVFPESILVFTNDRSGVANNISLPASTRYERINLDDLDRIDKELSKGLSPDPKKARQQFNEMMNRPKWPSIVKSLEAAAFKTAKAARFNIQKIPAIVFNDRDVVYGIGDLREALTIYTHYKRTNQ